MLGAPLGIALYAVLGFFNGIGRPTITLRVTLVVAITNALLNQLFIFGFGLGVAGSAWATGAAQLVGLATAFAWFFSPANRRRYRSHLTSRFAPAPLLRQMSLGFPMGLLLAADILGFALFQLMQVRLGNVDGASTQIVLMLTSFCYMPAVGIAMAGTTLVGQAIGAGTPDWARTAGNGIILLAVVYMGIVGVALAAIGPWVLPWFTNLADAQGVQVVTEGCSAVVDRRGLPALRRAQHLERSVPARRGRCTSALAHGAGSVVVTVRSARTCSLVQAGRRMGRLAPAIRARRARRLARRTHLHLLSRNDVVPALALGRMAPRGTTMMRAPPAVLAACCLLALFTRNALGGPDAPPLAQAIAAEHIAASGVSYVVLDVESGRIAASLEPGVPRSPASTVKVVTTFAALDSLGPAYTWHTQALLQGSLEDGVLHGDLILKGGGDPYMTLERWWSFVQELRAKGLQRSAR